MSTSRNEFTIAAPCSVSGRGYWTGQFVQVQIEPASAGTGIQLIRRDLPGHPGCRAIAANRRETPLRTIICRDAARFEMVEHMMAALYALQIDNCRVSIDGAEFPGLDGSCLPFYDALAAAGREAQDAVRSRLVITESVRLETADRWIQVDPLPKDSTHNGARFEYRLSFDQKGPIPAQTFAFDCTPQTFADEVAGARTFVTQAQAEMLQAQGVAAHVTKRDLLIFGDDGPIGNELRYSDECARHKTLDLIGDLALAQCDLVGSVVSFRGGHTLNGRLAERLAALNGNQIQAGSPDSEANGLASQDQAA